MIRSRPVPASAALLLAGILVPSVLAPAVLARPVNPGGLGGPRSGAGVLPGAGAGRAGVGLDGRPGVGYGGLGGPASGAGVRPGVGWGAPGPGLTRAPAAAYGAAVVHPGWGNGGYWAARPWSYGWYGPSPMPWWGATAGLMTGAAIAAAVNSSVAAQSPVIVVSNTPYQLNYASVQGLTNQQVRFTYVTSGIPVTVSGDCRLGLINGVTVAGANAQLLNTACSVAFGTGS